MKSDQFMRRAIDLAVENARSGTGGPFGALVVKDGQILAEGVNLVISSHDPTAHAEVMAIRRACEVLGSHQLGGCEVYTSCEPCLMCLGAIFWARPAAIYYAGTHEQAAHAGFDDSFIRQQMGLEPGERAIPATRLLGELGSLPFDAWLDFLQRVPY